jgi:hypothetical protein
VRLIVRAPPTASLLLVMVLCSRSERDQPEWDSGSPSRKYPTATFNQVSNQPDQTTRRSPQRKPQSPSLFPGDVLAY